MSLDLVSLHHILPWSNQRGLSNTAIAIRGLHKPRRSRLRKRYITATYRDFLHASWRMPAVVEANHIPRIDFKTTSPPKVLFLGTATPAVGVSREKDARPPSCSQDSILTHRPVE